MGNYVFDTVSKVNLLNNYFASVNVKDNDVIPNFSAPDVPNKLTEIDFTACTVYKFLCKLKYSMAAGPDGYPPLFFKKLASCLPEPLCMLYSFIFKCESLPSI